MKPLFAIFLLIGFAALGQGRNFTRASSQGYSESAPVTFYPITVTAWARCSSISANGTVLSIGHTTSGNRTQLLFQNTGTFQVQSGPGALYGPTAVTVSTGVWYHVAAVVTVSGSTMTITQYTNGVSAGSGSGTDAGADPLWNAFAAGQRHNGTSWGTFFEGDVADVCIWNVALDAGEIASLASGCSPMLVRPGNLRGWLKLGESVFDRVTGGTITASGTPVLSVSSPPLLWGIR